MRVLVLAGLLIWVSVAQASDFWNGLWHTPDQQGEQLMQQGKATEAAKIFSDPRRKAYAELQAGDYQHAAQDFTAFDDSNGNYNRGNALAHVGQLQEAINAYDAALAHDPKNLDARHNRDLVASALQKQPPKPKSASGNDSKSGDNNKNQADNKKDVGKQGANKKNPSPQNPSDNGQQNKASLDKTSQGKSSQARNNGASADQEQQQPAPANTSQSARVGDQPKPADEATQAKLDAATAQEKLPAGRRSARINAPISEKQLAQEQWLRHIPDDPGGLLRRKFMIEHMIRQQGTKP